MGIGIDAVRIACDLHMRGVWSGYSSVLDMGAQELHVTPGALAACLRDAGIADLEPLPAQVPAESPERLWRPLGFTNCDQLDQLPGTDLRQDLNYPLTEGGMRYDLVTDFGNNEHVFNVGEAYRTMHRLTTPGGCLWIQQAWIGGNGLYAFTPDFFEAIAAANRYTFIASFLIVNNAHVSCVLPYDLDTLSLLARDGTEGVHHSHVLRRTSEADFTWPGEGSYNSGGFPYRICWISPPVPAGRMTLPLTSGDFADSVALLTIGAILRQVRIGLAEVMGRILNPAWWRRERPLARRRA